MLRCPVCNNEDEFIVTERLLQRSRIACTSSHDYNWIEVVETLQVDEWFDIDCGECGATSDEDSLKEVYNDAHGEDDDPIPYTLVDASTT